MMVRPALSRFRAQWVASGLPCFLEVKLGALHEISSGSVARRSPSA
jgi:hypothetical protein